MSVQAWPNTVTLLADHPGGIGQKGKNPQGPKLMLQVRREETAEEVEQEQNEEFSE